MAADIALQKIRLKRLIESAIALRFWDDVAHYRAELKKLEEESKEN